MMQFEPIVVENPGFVAYGRPPDDAVVVITGIPRSQTTRATWMFGQVPGVHLFRHRKHGNCEDYELFELIEAGDTEAARRVVEGRPHGKKWVIKRPYAWRYRSQLVELFGDRLTWVFLFRDPLAVAGKEFTANGGDLEDWLQTIAETTHELIAFALDAPPPKVLLSGEKLVNHQAEFFPRIKEWLT